MSDLQVRDVMTHLVVTFRPDDNIEEAARRLITERISGGPVLVDGKVVGVVSEADLIQAFVPPPSGGFGSASPYPLLMLLRGASPTAAKRVTVKEVMSTRVVSIAPEAKVWAAAALIEKHGVRRLPVVDDEGYLVGLIARADLIRAMAMGSGVPA